MMAEDSSPKVHDADPLPDYMVVFSENHPFHGYTIELSRDRRITVYRGYDVHGIPYYAVDMKNGDDVYISFALTLEGMLALQHCTAAVDTHFNDEVNWLLVKKTEPTS